MRLLIDTNVYVGFRNGEPQVVEMFREAESLTLSTVVVGELHFGFQNGSKLRTNVASLMEFMDQPLVEVVDVTCSTAEHFGILSASLRKRGTPIPTNDIWIASHAFETGTHLLTFDRHFEKIDNLLKTVLVLT